ncbi:MAG: DEAD/DEAH box helicase, partial [Bacteroidetes bacterium]
MGLGKTLQTIAVLLHAKAQKKGAGPPVATQLDIFAPADDLDHLQPLQALIVLPASLVFNWGDELRKFAPSLSVYRHVGPKRHKDPRLLTRFDVLLTTYQTALKDAAILEKMAFEYIVLDESQQIKNKDSKVFKALNKMTARHKISLSGTPIENSLSDLWSQMQFINPGLLGNFTFFKKAFITPIEKGGDEARKEELRQLVAPFLLRRTKEEVAKDLPELDIRVFYSEMAPEQKKLYEKEKSKARNYLLENYNQSSFEYNRLVIQTLLRLRQLVNHPRLVFEDYKKGSGKFTDVIEQWEVVNRSNHKTLIFSTFVQYLELFKDWFSAHNFEFSWLTGGVPQSQRARQIEQFQNREEVRSFLISTKAGGTGLNLTAADYVFILDPWWNPAAEKQAIARAHRIGQTKKVFALKFITKDSIEEKILKLQERKAALAEDILAAAGKHPISKTDLEFLLD